MKRENSSSAAVNTGEKKQKNTLNQQIDLAEHGWAVKKREILQRSGSSPPTINTFCITDQFTSILFCAGSVFVRFSGQDLLLSKGQIEHTQPSV